MPTNIKIIVENALCTGCGACAGICKDSAIQMKESPSGYLHAEIKEDLCTNCKLCLLVCPSNKENKYELPKNILYGNCLDAYIGYSVSEKIRKKSQSGGVVTSLLVYLLDNKLIEGTIVTQFDSETARPKAKFATTTDEIINASGSYYAQTSVINTIMKNNDKLMAVTALGCQAESLHLIKKKFQKIKQPEYVIGLICAEQCSGWMIDDIIKQAHIDQTKEKIFSFRFRSKAVGGWPGNIEIYSNKERYTLPQSYRKALIPLYRAHRCLVCYDKMNIFSDLVCGDPWGFQYHDLPEGYTVIITRTSKGEQLIRDAQEAGYIKIAKISAKDIINGQNIDTIYKQKVLIAKDVFKKKHWLYPYNDSVIKNISDKKNNTKGKLISEFKLKKQLEHTRQFYISKNTQEAKISKLKSERIEKNISRIDKLINSIKGLYLKIKH